MLVYHEGVELLQHLPGDLPHWCQVYERAGSLPCGDLHGPQDDLERDLHLGHEHARASDRVGGFVDIVRGEAPVGAGRDGDGVLPVGREGYERGARGPAGGGFDQAGIHALVGEGLDEGLAETVVPHASEKRYSRAEEGGRGGLVGALAAVALRELRLSDGLAGLRTALHAQDEVLVDRTNDEDVSHEDAPLPTGC